MQRRCGAPSCLETVRWRHTAPPRSAAVVEKPGEAVPLLHTEDCRLPVVPIDRISGHPCRETRIVAEPSTHDRTDAEARRPAPPRSGSLAPPAAGLAADVRAATP